MDDRIPRHWRAGNNFEQERALAQRRRADRHALWALLLAVFTLAVAAASAHGSSGGVASSGSDSASPGTTSAASPATTNAFGSRELRVGMEGDDVRVLNGIIKSKSYATGVRVSSSFARSTEGAVREFQILAGLPASGVVDRITGDDLIRSMDRAGVTWYGPGFFGSQTACGIVLRQATIGVANRTLPCGTRVTFAYHGHTLVAPVIDRGPYTRGNMFDLTQATAEGLGVTGTAQLRYAIGRQGSDTRGL